MQIKIVMGKINGVRESDFSISGNRVGGVGLLQGVERRLGPSRPIPSDKQKRIDRILEEMKHSSDRMEKLLAVFNRINRGL